MILVFALLAVAVQGAVLPVNSWANLKHRNFSDGTEIGRIYGGTDVTDIKDRNFQVSMFMDTSYFCGGSLIRNDVVLTAAHCTRERTEFEVHLGSVTLGAPRETVITQNKAEHPEYDPTTYENDIALVKLGVKVPVSDYINVISRPKNLDDPEGSQPGDGGIVSGWGLWTKDHASLSTTLKTANIDVLDSNDCKPPLSSARSQGQFCTKSKYAGNNIKHPCIGDSGGPMTYEPLLIGGIRQVGIVSMMNLADCGNPDVTPIFTRVSHYVDWINNNMN